MNATELSGYCRERGIFSEQVLTVAELRMVAPSVGEACSEGVAIQTSSVFSTAQNAKTATISGYQAGMGSPCCIRVSGIAWR